MYKIIDGNKACADVAYLFSEIASIYPITPSSPMAAEVDVLSHSDRKNLFNDDVKVIEMQSEAGAAGTMHGALLAGSLATTFTASQGLLLMIPNMYKMAGECLPAVIHVAARTLATHALSIFGDHSDVYATRGTGFCMLASSNVEQANHMAAVAHLSAIKGSLPFVHFFDGFRTSHEVNKVKELNDEDLIKLVDFDKVNEFKKRMLNVDAGIQKGMAENEDIYFQSVEARNELYNVMPDIVYNYMKEINKLTGMEYRPFNYYGCEDAENVIVAMGSVCDTVKLVVDDLNNNRGAKVGLIEVHLYRPFSAYYLKKVLPNTVKNIAVLDRTKEAGSIGEPLYLDVIGVFKDTNIKVVGGRYGLSSKNTTPDQIFSVYEMLNSELKDNFTIGIVDDVTNLSLPKYDYNIDLGAQEIKIFGFGSDGMVSTSKDIMKIMGAGTDKFVQSYNQYDSKKSGGVTICNLRISDKSINAPFYVTNPGIVVLTKDEYLFKFDMIDDIKENGIFVINTTKNQEELDGFLPNKVKRIINNKNVKLYIIDADKIAMEAGIKGKISKIMQMVIMSLMNYPDAMNVIAHSIEKQFATKGDEVINANKLAITKALEALVLVNTELTVVEEDVKLDKNIFDEINARRGDLLTVKDLVPFREGTFPCGLSKNEKRKTSTFVPKWNSEACIQCGQCAIVCPHAVIRPIVHTDKSAGVPMIGKPEYTYEMVVSEADCTSCGLCINVCPGKGGVKALEFGVYDDTVQQRATELFENHENPDNLFPKFTIKGSQFIKPKFEFSGSCAGCGETPYIKLLTQLFGDKLVIANATGCSSIYGGSAPSTPYSIPWANSLFEDNAEFGFGMLLSYNKSRDRIEKVMRESSVDGEVKELYTKWLENREDFDITRDIKDKLIELGVPSELKDLIDYVPARSVWTLGGDGWAYDIGFGGIDHVLSSGENVNILVLDTEVYSNTGGQASKSSRIGQVAQFADNGKKTAKKDLFKIAMGYPNCYVANVSFGSNFMQTIKAFKEAEEHNGPSIIIAYCPCIEQGIKGGMNNATSEQKLVVDCGYTTLMRYTPENEKLTIDSREPDFSKYEQLLNNEVRYNSLVKKNPELAKEVLELNKQEAMKRYNYYKKLSEEKSE